MSDMPISPIQQRMRRLAAQRLLAFEQDFKTRGIVVECGLEHEFFTTDAQGVPDAKTAKTLRETLNALLEHSPTIEIVKPEIATSFSALGSQSELIVGSGRGHRHSPMSPIIAARSDVAAMKLVDRASRAEGHVANSSAHLQGRNTSGLHINVSLWTVRDEPLFFDPEARENGESDLAHHAVDSLLKIQREGLVCFVPTEASLRRIKHSMTAPSILGLDPEFYSEERRYSLSLRHDSGDVEDPIYYRIENSLPGADADPYLAITATVGALHDAVKANLLPDGSVTPHTGVHPTRAIPGQIAMARREFNQSPRMQELLGPELHEAALEYIAELNASKGRAK